MIVIPDALTLYLHAARQLGHADHPTPDDWHGLPATERRAYETAISALDTVEDPLERAQTLHRAIGALWNAPPWEGMMGPQRATYVFLAGPSPLVDGIVPLPTGRPDPDTPRARKAWDEAAKDHPHHASLRRWTARFAPKGSKK